jgi:hypothetical protein
LLIQSLLLILSQLLLLSICLHYRPHPAGQEDPTTYAPLSPIFDASNQDQEAEYEARSHRRQESAFLPRPPVGESHNPQNASAFKGRLPDFVGEGFGKKRPFDFWRWAGFGTYLEFLAGMILVLGALQVILGRWMW